MNLDNDELIIINGAALNIKKDDSSKFNAILINTLNHTAKTHVFSWDSSKEEYILSNKPHERKMPICSGNIRQDVSFIKKLHRMEQFDDYDIDDYYVFPPLQIYTDGVDKKEIKDVKQFDDLVNSKKTIIIEGGDFSGKTALSHFLYLRYKDLCTPVFFTKKNIEKKDLGDIAQNTFNLQYNKDIYTWTKFINDNNNKKIAIIDDAHIYRPDDLNMLLKELSTYFDIFIILTRMKWDYKLVDLIRERIENASEKGVIRLTMQPLYFQKRLKLIEKVCHMYQNQSGRNFEIKHTVQKLDKLISNELSIFNQNPGFTILFILYALENNQYDTEKRIFNAAFEANITTIIQKNKSLDITTAFFVLQLLAYQIRVNKKYPFPLSSFALIIENYNDDGKGYRRVIDPNEIINELINTKILKIDALTGGIVFVTDSVLAYFIAKALKNISDESAIKKLISNSCFGINGLILLFLSYLSGNCNIVRFLLNELDDLTKEIPELSFDSKNINFLFEGISKTNIQFSDESYSEYKESKDFAEKSISNYQIESVKLYDYSESDFTEIDKITKTFKLIELISRLLPDFIYDLDTDDIILIVKSLYIQPNKLLYWLFNDIDQNFDQFVTELTRLLAENKMISEYSRIDWISNIINEVSVKTIFALYHKTSRYASSINTVNALSYKPTKNNTNYKIQELFFKDGFEGTDSVNFSKELFEIYRTTQSDLIKRITEELLKHHIVSRSIKNVGAIQSIIDLMLANDNNKSKDKDPIFKTQKNKKPKMIDIRKKRK